MTRSAAPAGAAHNGSRAESTRTSLLDAAREVFVELGYPESSVNAIVERAGASVGSLYHHFGGKPDVFNALYESYQRRAIESAAQEVARARADGVNDPIELFVWGSRGYLKQCRIDKDLTSLFLQGDGPPGFNQMRRQMSTEWIRQNGRLIRAPERRNGDALVTVLTTVSGAAGRAVAAAESDEKAASLIDDFCELIRKVAEGP